ncbi:ATP-dependent DNA ligase [Candidatus Dojkabacteria bacterium]|uniref:DNA ligase (ATP) n=1 Tax=Candidatus Dojkabacteria bacterium TaxID=2099670 RepID=A0A955L5U2_9BACT|nr:ATP-dependent DNA ligase [Candidatus Dojkabacteria bacterium]
MQFNDLCEYLVKLEDLSSRNEMTEILVELFSKLEGKEIDQAIYFMQGRIAPLYEPIEFNLSIKLVLKALEAHSSNNDIQALFKKLGDVGLVAEEVNKDSGLSKYSITSIFEHLNEIAEIEGTNSQSAKQTLLQELAQNTSGLELKYITRIIVGKLRLGLSDKTFLDALSWYLSGDKSLRAEIERAYGVNADLGYVARLVIEGGVEAIKDIHLTPGIPVASKLVQREATPQTLFERLGDCYIQPKYDGLRLQVHYDKNGLGEEKVSMSLLGAEKKTVKMFSRNMENLTYMMPDVIEQVELLGVESIIFDSEAIGFDPSSGELVSFQETISRKRKTGIIEAAKATPLKVFAFDILHINGRDLMQTGLEERLQILKEVVDSGKSENIEFAESVLVKSAEELDAKFKEYTDAGLEGLIAKDLGTLYEPGTRNYDWIKLKVKAQKELADTVDAVVLGYYSGRGVRAKFGIGALLIGCYDNKNDKYLSLAKLGTGIKDSDWPIFKKALDEISVDALAENVEIDKQVMPDVLVRPEIVVVVEADEVTVSKVHGYVGKDGLSLRFPRLKQFAREDKDPEQITTVEELEQLAKL